MSCLRKYVAVLALYAVAGSLGCADPTTPDLEIEERPDIFDGEATALVNGRVRELRLLVNPSAYDLNQVVIRASADSLGNILMMTFDLETGVPEVNYDMTGFWDLGFCIPFDRHLMTGSGYAFIRVTRYVADSGYLAGSFDLRAVSEESSDDVVTFRFGRFRAYVDPEPFEYCVEG